MRFNTCARWLGSTCTRRTGINHMFQLQAKANGRSRVLTNFWFWKSQHAIFSTAAMFLVPQGLKESLPCSCESELHSIVSGMCDAICIRRVLEFMLKVQILQVRNSFVSSPSRFKQLVATLTSSGGECHLQV